MSVHFPWRGSLDRRSPNASTVLRVLAGLLCLLIVVPNGFSAPANNQTPAPLLGDDGFTRESLQEFDAPPAEPAPLVKAPAASVDESSASSSASVVIRRHHRARHHQEATPDQPRDVVVKAAHRRNPVESFVYWWNGWVIRNFHTRNGTVLLDKIGAQT